MESEPVVAECCVCFEVSSESLLFVKTPCHHPLCTSCRSRLERSECPTCRGRLERITTEGTRVVHGLHPAGPYTLWGQEPRHGPFIEDLDAQVEQIRSDRAAIEARLVALEQHAAARRGELIWMGVRLIDFNRRRSDFQFEIPRLQQTAAVHDDDIVGEEIFAAAMGGTHLTAAFIDDVAARIERARVERIRNEALAREMQDEMERVRFERARQVAAEAERAIAADQVRLAFGRVDRPPSRLISALGAMYARLTSR